MERLSLTLFLMLLANSGTAAPPHPADPAVLGTTKCDNSGHGALCRLEWSMDATARAFYWVEEMDSEASNWRRLSGLQLNRSTLTKDPLPGGRLYRVVGCADASGELSCLSSTVYWAPFQPSGADVIPSVVHDKKGVPMYVNKEGSLTGQKQQYNLYLLVRLMDGVSDMRSMPPMTAPRFGLDIPPQRVLTEGTVDDLIEQNAFAMYEARRTGEPLAPKNQD